MAEQEPPTIPSPLGRGLLESVGEAWRRQGFSAEQIREAEGLAIVDRPTETVERDERVEAIEVGDALEIETTYAARWQHAVGRVDEIKAELGRIPHDLALLSELQRAQWCANVVASTGVDPDAADRVWQSHARAAAVAEELGPDELPAPIDSAEAADCLGVWRDALQRAAEPGNPQVLDQTWLQSEQSLEALARVLVESGDDVYSSVLQQLAEDHPAAQFELLALTPGTCPGSSAGAPIDEIAIKMTWDGSARYFSLGTRYGAPASSLFVSSNQPELDPDIVENRVLVTADAGHLIDSANAGLISTRVSVSAIEGLDKDLRFHQARLAELSHPYFQQTFELRGELPSHFEAEQLVEQVAASMHLPLSLGEADLLTPEAARLVQPVLDRIGERATEPVGLTVLPISFVTEQGHGGETVLFSVQGDDGNPFFVDTGGWRYEDVSDWLENNRLPPGVATYPEDLRFSTGGDRMVKVAGPVVTPATVDTPGEVVTQYVLSVGAAGLGVASFVVTGGVSMLALGGLLTAGGLASSAHRLQKMADHGVNPLDPENLSNPEVLLEWADLGGSLAAFCVMGSGLLGQVAPRLGLGAYYTGVAGDVVGMSISGGVMVSHWDELSKDQRAVMAGQMVFWLGSNVRQVRAAGTGSFGDGLRLLYSPRHVQAGMLAGTNDPVAVDTMAKLLDGEEYRFLKQTVGELPREQRAMMLHRLGELSADDWMTFKPAAGGAPDDPSAVSIQQTTVGRDRPAVTENRPPPVKVADATQALRKAVAQVEASSLPVDRVLQEKLVRAQDLLSAGQTEDAWRVLRRHEAGMAEVIDAIYGVGVLDEFPAKAQVLGDGVQRQFEIIASVLDALDGTRLSQPLTKEEISGEARAYLDAALPMITEDSRLFRRLHSAEIIQGLAGQVDWLIGHESSMGAMPETELAMLAIRARGMGSDSSAAMIEPWYAQLAEAVGQPALLESLQSDLQVRARAARQVAQSFEEVESTWLQPARLKVKAPRRRAEALAEDLELMVNALGKDLPETNSQNPMTPQMEREVSQVLARELVATPQEHPLSDSQVNDLLSWVDSRLPLGAREGLPPCTETRRRIEELSGFVCVQQGDRRVPLATLDEYLMMAKDTLDGHPEDIVELHFQIEALSRTVEDLDFVLFRLIRDEYSAGEGMESALEWVEGILGDTQFVLGQIRDDLTSDLRGARLLPQSAASSGPGFDIDVLIGHLPEQLGDGSRGPGPDISLDAVCAQPPSFDRRANEQWTRRIVAEVVQMGLDSGEISGADAAALQELISEMLLVFRGLSGDRVE